MGLWRKTNDRRRRDRRRTLPWHEGLSFESLEDRALLAGDPILSGQPLIISEIVADNSSSLLTRTRVSVVAPFEGAADSPDWIELMNVSERRQELGGLHLTDDASDPTKWEFPAGTTVEAGGFLVVFASGDDIRNAALDEHGYLHTNFSLNGEGEYLALTDRDGAVIHEFAPQFPSQRVDVSYSVPMESRTLLGSGDSVEYLVPRDDSLEPQWRLSGFSDDDLLKATQTPASPLGFDRGDGPVEQGRTIGGEVIDRGSIDFSRGSIVVLDSMPFASAGQVSEWSFYSETMRSLTPLILQRAGEEYEIVGVGLTRVSDGTGVQTFAFGLQSGSDLVEASGYVFGFKDGDNQTDDPGAVVYERSETDSVRRYNGPQSGNLEVGRQLMDGRSFGRTYSVQATTRPRLAGPIQTDVAAAMSAATSLYVRYLFDVEPTDTLRALTLQIRYEDGFVAYLNGTEVARRNVPTSVTYDATAMANRQLEDANQFDELNISEFLGSLKQGENVLAVHGLNDAVDGADFLIDASLQGVQIESALATGFARRPTPGRINGEVSAGVVSPTWFSVTRGIHVQPFQLELSTPELADATIYFTLDGSDPLPQNPQAVRYVQPLEIAGTTVLRAASYQEGLLPSLPQTHTYIFPEDVAEQTTLNAAVTADPVWGPKLAPSLQSLPTLSLVTGNAISAAAEVGTSVELIDPRGEMGFQVDAGVEVYGGTAVAFPKQSMRLSFKNVYGPSTLEFDVFNDPDGVVQFDQLLLRAGSHDTPFWNGAGGAGAYLRNRWASDRQLEMGQPAPRGRFVHLYINGKYWGQYHLMERPNAAFMASNYGGAVKDYDVLNAGRPIDGDTVAWNELLESLDEGYEAVRRYLDVVNYADYILLQWFGGNDVDWRSESNWIASRRREADAGFQFFAWDADIMLRTSLQTDIVNYGGPGFLWTLHGGVQQYPEFRELLAERAQRYFFDGGMFTAERLRQDIDTLADEMRDSVIAETARWGSGIYTPETWEKAVRWIKDTYAPAQGPSRAEVVIEQMRQAGYFPLTDTPQLAQDDRIVLDGQLSAGALLSMSAPRGEIYYTLDGSDPREHAATVETTTLVGDSSPVRVIIPADGSLGAAWQDPAFDDSEWISGKNGVGYDVNGELSSLIQLDVEQAMNDVNATAYVRVPFLVDDPALFDTLELSVRYDDGFVAYLNGVEVARRFAPSSVGWSSRATAAHANVEAIVPERFNLSRVKELLRPGENVLAIHGLNTEPNNVDFLLIPELRAGRVTDAGVSASAIQYAEAFPVPEDAQLKARTRWADQWSPLRSAAVPVERFPLRISEVMYHPADPSDAEVAAGFTDADEFEFVEVMNISDAPIDLAKIRLTPTDVGGQANGVAFDFGSAAIQQLAPGQVALVVENRAAFEFRYGSQLPVAGQWSGGLSNRSEQITVMVGNDLLQQFTYVDDWYPPTDGEGASLEFIDVTTSDLDRWNQKAAWRASDTPGGTPGVGIATVVVGDSNRDGVFDSRDLLAVLQASEYEDGLDGNSSFATGDWNRDGDFTTADLVFAFQQGSYLDDVLAARIHSKIRA